MDIKNLTFPSGNLICQIISSKP